MCRSIKRLNNKGVTATKDEVNAAALQFVRKISGTRNPSKINQKAFNKAVNRISKDSQILLNSLSSPKNFEVLK